MADNELDKAIEEILERFMYSFTHLDDPMDLRLTTTALKTLLTSEKNKAVLEARQDLNKRIRRLERLRRRLTISLGE